MPQYEYKVVPAPERARKVRGLKGPALFAHALEEVMNDLGADGWTYLRADTLPQEERSGLTSKTTTYRNLLVFQREIASGAPVTEATADPAPVPVFERHQATQPETAPAQERGEDEDITNLWQEMDVDDEAHNSAAPVPPSGPDAQR